MIIAGRYSFKGGIEVVSEKYPKHLKEIEDVIAKINADEYKNKVSEEKNMKGKLLYSPVEMNTAIKKEFEALGWKNHREKCEYPTEYYVEGYEAKELNKGAFREMDFVKDKIGIEVQFGKYSFMVYNVAAKMTIFHNLKVIDYGVEIVPVKKLADEMSSGVSYYEQFLWDLEKRGVADIDIPVLILGIDANTSNNDSEEKKPEESDPKLDFTKTQ